MAGISRRETGMIHAIVRLGRETCRASLRGPFRKKAAVASLTRLHVLGVEVQSVRDLRHVHAPVVGHPLLLLRHRHHLLHRLLLVIGPDLSHGQRRGGGQQGEAEDSGMK